MLGAVACVTFLAVGALAQRTGSNGTTLAATKTIEICKVDVDTWRYSGEISLWNQGVLDTIGLAINDCIQNKTGGGQFKDAYCTTNFDPALTEIPAGTTLETATVFKYSIEGDPLAGDIRNIAKITILNHSGSLGKPKGPEPKDTWTGGDPPLCDQDLGGGCTYTQGYWGNKPGVVWPAEFDRTSLFFNSGLTWQQVLDASAGGNGYVILAKQYIAAVLNQANGADVPTGVQEILTLATGYFAGAADPYTACPAASDCGAQKTWGGILDSYNNGEYPGGPLHCEEN